MAFKTKSVSGQQKKSELSVMIVAKQNKLGIRLAKKLADELRNYTSRIHFDRSTGVKLSAIGTNISKFDGDLIITVGGDGTLLWTAHQTGKPILPVRIEGHGFLCTIDYKDLMKNLKAVINKKYEITERIRLKCSKVVRGKVELYLSKLLPRAYPYALNEIVFARKRPSKILITEFKIDDIAFQFSGDGILFSTPAGSTAYSASAGGPLMDPQLSAICIVPLYPFYSNVKPIIIPSDKKIEVKVKSGECALIVDGHGGDYLGPETEFIIERGEPLRVVSIAHHNFYERFKKKFL